jgi:hypothetical protein
MARFNDSYLKPALDGLKESAGSILDNTNSITDRINAESDAVRNKSQADLSFKRNVSFDFNWRWHFGHSTGMGRGDCH